MIQSLPGTRVQCPNQSMSHLRHVPAYAEHTTVKANRVDARFVDHKNKKVWAVEMSCPWMEHREKKSEEKTVKYGPLRFELK